MDENSVVDQEVNETAATDDTTPEESTSYQKELDKLKARLSRANSEAADYKRQLRERMSADEAAKADREEQLNAMKSELEELRRGRTLSDYTAKFAGLGLAEGAAISAAEALADGKTDDLFSGLKTFLETVKKSAVSEAMSGQKGLSSGEPVQGADKDKAYNDLLRKAMGLN